MLLNSTVDSIDLKFNLFMSSQLSLSDSTDVKSSSRKDSLPVSSEYVQIAGELSLCSTICALSWAGAEKDIILAQAAITKYHRLHVVETVSLSQFWRPEVLDQGAG